MTKYYIKITNSSNGIELGEIEDKSTQEYLINEFEDNNLKNMLFFEIRDYIIDEEWDGYAKVVFEIPIQILLEKINKIKENYSLVS